MTTPDVSSNSQKTIPASPLQTPDDPIDYLVSLAREYGDIVSFPRAYGPAVFFNHPDLVQAVLHNPNFIRTLPPNVSTGQGLLATEGDLWRSRRRMMQPLFHDHCMPAFAPVITDVTLEMLRSWDETGMASRPFDFALEMRHLALDVTLRALFSSGREEGNEVWDGPLTILYDDFSAMATTLLNMPFTFSAGAQKISKQAMEALNRHLYGMIEKRKALQDKPRDLLTLLMSARDEHTGELLTDVNIRDEIVSMLLAGHETTSVALAWTFHELSRNPAIEADLVADVDRVLAGRIPTIGDLDALPGLRMLLEETMRLNPPVWYTSRRAVVDDAIAGYPIPAKTVAIISPYTIHRHPAFWDDPERFDPGRFSPERSKKRHRYAYFPFMGGRHQCIGQSFSMLKMQLIIALLLQRCRIRAVPGHPVEPKPQTSLRMRHGMMVTMEKRG